MTPEQSITTWLAQLKAGDAEAAQALWQRYFVQLVELARQHLARGVPQPQHEIGRDRRLANLSPDAIGTKISTCHL